MFSLIITIVAIALVSLLAVATLFYGSDAQDNARVSAEASKALNSMQQVHAAVTFYTADKNQPPPDLAALEGHYLKSIPEGDWDIHAAYVASNVTTLDACKDINRRLDFVVTTEVDPDANGVPNCSLVPNVRLCCENVESDPVPAG